MAYSYTNSRGVTYYLHTREVTLKGGRVQRIYWFAKTENPEYALDAVPAGYVVMETKKSGLPVLKKAA